MIYESEGHLAAELAIGQRILRLQDWNIAVKIDREHKMQKPAQAEVNSVFERRDASIVLLDPLDYCDVCSFFPQNHRVSLAHELLHLHMDSMEHAAYPEIDTPEPFRLAMEQVICSLAPAIAQLMETEPIR